MEYRAIVLAYCLHDFLSYTFEDMRVWPLRVILSQRYTTNAFLRHLHTLYTRFM